MCCWLLWQTKLMGIRQFQGSMCVSLSTLTHACMNKSGQWVGISVSSFTHVAVLLFTVCFFAKQHFAFIHKRNSSKEKEFSYFSSPQVVACELYDCALMNTRNIIYNCLEHKGLKEDDHGRCSIIARDEWNESHDCVKKAVTQPFSQLNEAQR